MRLRRTAPGSDGVVRHASVRLGRLRKLFRFNASYALRYSYGGGIRIALSEALVARIDVGFSDEEQGLTYLEFGQTF